MALPYFIVKENAASQLSLEMITRGKSLYHTELVTVSFCVEINFLK